MRQEDYRNAMKEASTLAEYIKHAGDFGDKATQDELRNMRAIIAKLERMGIKQVELDIEGTIDPVKTLHVEYFIAFITMVLLVGGAIYGFTHLVKTSIKQSADAPGAIVGHVRTPSIGGLRPAINENVLLLAAPDDKGEVHVMASSATSVDQIWQALGDHMGAWKSAIHTQTDANGQFLFGALKPGIYTLVATSSNPHMSWTQDVRIEPGLRVSVDLSPENCIKPHR
jgi:hypothetical protein